MAAITLTAPNLRRFDVPEVSSFPWTGVMRDLDDLVERVMAKHIAKLQSLDEPEDLVA